MSTFVEKSKMSAKELNDTATQVLSRTEKIGYGLGDAASHIVFDNVMFYMMFFIRILSDYRLVLLAPCFYWQEPWMLW